MTLRPSRVLRIQARRARIRRDIRAERDRIFQKNLDWIEKEISQSWMPAPFARQYLGAFTGIAPETETL